MSLLDRLKSIAMEEEPAQAAKPTPAPAAPPAKKFPVPNAVLPTLHNAFSQPAPTNQMQQGNPLINSVTADLGSAAAEPNQFAQVIFDKSDFSQTRIGQPVTAILNTLDGVDLTEAQRISIVLKMGKDKGEFGEM